MSILDKIAESGVFDSDQEFGASDEGFSQQFPGIYEFLARTSHKGAKRKPGRIIMYYDAGKAAICLSDAESKQVAFHIGQGLLESLEAVEGRLQAGSLDWRHSKRWQG